MIAILLDKFSKIFTPLSVRREIFHAKNKNKTTKKNQKKNQEKQQNTVRY